MSLLDYATKRIADWFGLNGSAFVYCTEIRAGEPAADSPRDCRVAIAAWKKVALGTTGAVTGIEEGHVFGGIIVTSSTDLTITAYDNSEASGVAIIPVTTTLAAGQFVSPLGGGVGPVTAANQSASGLELTTGLFLTVGGSGTGWVLYR